MTTHSPQSCATCARKDCRLSFVSRDIAPVAERVAWVVDRAWPEYRRFAAAQMKPEDQLLSPGLFGRRLDAYNWPAGEVRAGMATLQRHLMLRQVATARGSVRQAAYLKADEALAAALARHIDYRAQHLVISQVFLPYLWRDGALGGRSFDVLMTRYPLAELHARLDEVAIGHADSTTIADFRAPDALVEQEAEALSAARRIVTPHHDIAEGFGERAVWLDWDQPAPRTRRKGMRTAFLGPVITRQGAHTVREMAKYLAQPLIVFGAELEGADFWGAVPVERRSFGPGWLDDIAAILHPAVVTHEPRRLVEAVAHGVTVYAAPSCGLAPGQYRLLDLYTEA
ncbi:MULTISPECIES: hypothetical protein [Asticcacaulis]|uniref:hypothetical protein n=1 Tax=Asticcacaulis TaxID=76890 RepID=UPI001AE1F101|nr:MULTISPECIES: hypothetical protein [Asticcacaulis]MBP2161393.1 sirohydrochlorin ferrochelatase [Asticcacaulis solisilvae]MDR6802438.1 sirohydrochlorin ferrochelatase [Asticcacaulis sp. BE141]